MYIYIYILYCLMMVDVWWECYWDIMGIRTTLHGMIYRFRSTNSGHFCGRIGIPWGYECLIMGYYIYIYNSYIWHYMTWPTIIYDTVAKFDQSWGSETLMINHTLGLADVQNIGEPTKTKKNETTISHKHLEMVDCWSVPVSKNPNPILCMCVYIYYI